MGKFNVSKNMQWALPYLEEANDIVPLKGVMFEGYRVPVGRKNRILGIAHKLPSGKHKIRLCLSRNIEAPVPRHQDYELEMLLTTLAHEVAHLKHWPHNAEHLALTALLFSIFADVAYRLGVKDTDTSPQID